jgi:signal transduction histidine kinase
VPASLAYSPAIRWVYWMVFALAILIAGLSIWLTSWAHEREFRKADDYESRMNSQASVQSTRVIAERIDRFISLTKSLGSGSDFKAPSDGEHDGARYMQRDRQQSHELALYDHIGSWLRSESGPVIPLLEDRSSPRSMALWQLARGLPVRSPGGILLAHSRRLIAENAISSNPEILSIAELDSRGRIVFLCPYRLQVRLKVFNASSTLLKPSTARVETQTLFHDSLLDGEDSKALSIVAPFVRSTGVYYLVMSLGPKFLAQPKPADETSFGVFDRGNDLLMYAGPQPALEAAILGKQSDKREYVNRSMIPIGGANYSLVTLTPASPVREAIATSLLTTISTCIASLLFVQFIAHRLLLWLTREQWKRDHLKAHIEKAAQGFAHDFDKVIWALRTTTNGISQKLAPTEIRELEGAITDLRGQSSHLAANLVAETFSLPGVPGGAGATRAESTTYLRGVLENVVGRYVSVLKHDIPLNINAGPSGEEPFAGISPTDLTRIMLNLLDNAIDACTAAETHDISVSVRTTERDVVIRVTDNGSGVDPSHRGRLFDPGFTTKGEERGKGLKLCLELAKNSGGDLRESNPPPERGTEMMLRLPRRPMPRWFVNKVHLIGKSTVVVVDDEGSVCEYWNKRFKERFDGINLPAAFSPSLVMVRSAEGLRSNTELLKSATHFLIDYKFDGEDITGIELIERLDLGERAILVTNHFEAPDVLKAVDRLGIKLLPKTYMFGVKFPIEIGDLP